MTEREAAVLTIAKRVLDKYFAEAGNSWPVGSESALLEGYKEIGKLLADDLPEGMK